MLADTDIRRLMLSCSSDQRPLFLPEVEDVQIQPASVDLRLGDQFVRSRYSARSAVDTKVGVDPKDSMVEQAEKGRYELQPGVFTLATTLERVWMPPTHVARVEGKSSLGRLGLMVHSTAGFIDPGFCGMITLEMFNLSSRPIILHLGMKVCQLSFSKLDSPCIRPYGHPELKSHYQGQTGVTESRISVEEKT